MNNAQNSTTLIGYVRVSTDEQGQSGLGLEAQQAQIETYCAANGITLLEVCIEVDSAVSGKRPVRFDMLRRVAAGEADGFIVAASSRISRSVVETADLIEWVERKTVRFISLDLGLDTSTPAGRMVATIMASVSQHEADQISQRTRSALAAKRARGETTCRPTVSDDTAKLIHQLRDEGFSIRGICAELDRRGVPTARGGQRWHTSAIQRTLGYKRPRRRVRAALPA